jgi:hypothetical protein
VPVLGIVLIGVAAVWLYAQPRAANGTFDSTAATPAYIVVNTPTQVTFTATITDRQLKKRSVLLIRLDQAGQPVDILGRMRDEGRNGDAQRNDNVYKLRTNFNEPNVGQLGFRVAARFKPGIWMEPEPDDDDWDRELAELENDPTPRRDRLARFLRKLGRYSLSEPFYVTVDPFTLPPDPGEAGKQTLEGIDSDNDGVRDDVQRWIALTYLNSERMRLGLRQNSGALQNALLANNAATAEAAAGQETAGARCLAYITDDPAVIDGLVELMLNTEVRREAYEQYTKLFHGPAGPIDLSQLKHFCAFDPDSVAD